MGLRPGVRYRRDERMTAKDSVPPANPSTRVERLAVTGSGQPSEERMNDPQAGFHQLLAELRPRLHRYCARMTGSVIDGEDVLQEALAKAIEAFPRSGAIANPEGWLFRIAHNAALDFLRRRARQQGLQADEDLAMIAEPESDIDRRQAAAASLQTLMRLPVTQRSSVILMDVLGHSLEEVSTVLDTTVPAVK